MSEARKKIVVIGNCQARSLASCVRAHAPSYDVVNYDVRRLHAWDRGQILSFLKEVSAAEVLLSQPLPDGGSFQMVEVEKSARNLVLFPYIVFTALHPDCIYIPGVNSAMGPYNSGLIAAAYLRGIARERVPGLFNALTYAKLKYTGGFEASAAGLKRRSSGLGYDLSEIIFGSEAFMHTINHPTVRLMSALSQQALGKSGLSYNPHAELPYDELSRSVWPIYPEVSQGLGIVGGYDFTYGGLMEGGGEFEIKFGLPEFVGKTYDIYNSIDRKLIATPEVDKIASVLGEMRVR